MLAPLGVPDEPLALPSVEAWRSRRSPGNRVGFFPASRKLTRQWPAEHFARLGQKLRDAYGCEIVVFWGDGDRGAAERVVNGIGGAATLSAATATLHALASQMSACRLVVSNCAGPKHVAVAAGIPTLTIHGSSDPKAWTPESPLHAAVRRDELHCIGCRLNDCPYALECLRDLSVERVFTAASKLLDRVPA